MFYVLILVPAVNPCSTFGPQYIELNGVADCYIQCAFERAFIRPCPTGLIWNPLITGCDWPTQAPAADASYGSVSYGASAPVSSYGASAPVSSYGARVAVSAPVASYGASAPVLSYGASAPVSSYGRKKRSAERKKRFLGGFGKPVVSEVPLGLSSYIYFQLY